MCAYRFYKIELLCKYFSRKSCSMEQLFDEHLFLVKTFFWMLVTFGRHFHKGKVNVFGKDRPLLVGRIFTVEPWRKEYLKKRSEKLLFFFFLLFVQLVEVFLLIFHFDRTLVRSIQDWAK